MYTDFLDELSKISLSLEELYFRFGYSKFKMNRFEPYSFYMENEKFLGDSRIITIQSPTGKLLALKPDVTMSIVKNHKTYEKSKIYYNEPVFKVPVGGNEFREIRQIGLEYIGEVSLYQTVEVLNLAIKSLKMIGNFKLIISDMSVINLLFEKYKIAHNRRQTIIKYLRQKNIHDLEKFLQGQPELEAFKKLLLLPADFKRAITNMSEDALYLCCKDNLDTLLELANIMEQICDMSNIMFDFSQVVGTEYYDGLTFTGYISGLPNKVLSGGRYDNLLRKMGEKEKSAIGFAVYLSEISKIHEKVLTKKIIKYTDSSIVETLKQANELYEAGINFCVRKEENND
ncbi:hypothetical protein AN642_01130 [Epulopiscium sp. SCG-B10WGA-EpuloA2]|nr:hypothetical protein AN642_01130 [Epulopiscium sp. SCG-B10WGA-EpuloA2]